MEIKEQKPIVASYSQVTTYTSCPKHWHIKYKLRYEEEALKASLFYGNAVEAGVIALLEGKENYLEIAAKEWDSQTKWGKTTFICDNDEIAYAHGDFDGHVLKDEDFDYLEKLARKLHIHNLGKSALEIYKEVARTKKNPYKKTTQEMLTYFNKASWLSLLRKSEVLIEAFKVQFLPKIQKIHAIQQESEIVSEDGLQKIKGYIDLILTIEGYDKPIIFDLKTSAGAYSQDRIDLSEQLLVYLAMEGITYTTNLVGYIVLNKNIEKEKLGVCSLCGKIKDSSHKTCDNEVNGKRCRGLWSETTKLKPEVQVMVSAKEDFKVDGILSDYTNVLKGMKEEIIYKNTDKCSNWYGSRCPYYSVCWENSFEGLKKK